MIVDEIQKEPYDEFAYAVRYSQPLAPGESISNCTLAATKLSDSSDISATFLESTTGTIPGGTATSGSTTTIVNTAVDHVTTGFRVGDMVVNATKGWSAFLTEIRTTTSKNDTLVFKAQSSAAAASDVYTAAKALASIKAGTDGDRVRVTFQITTSASRKYEDEILVNVKDH